MSTTTRNLLIAAGIILGAFLIWYFSAIILYILASVVLALIGQPIFDFLGRIHYRRLFLPAAVRSLLTLIFLMLILMSFLGIFIPLMVVKIQQLSELDPQILTKTFSGPFEKISRIINHFSLTPGKALTVEQMIQQIASNINVGKVAGIFGSVAGWLGNLSVAFFSICFITFFFLKDEELFSNALLGIIPDKYNQPVNYAMQATRKLLSRYFVGILIEVTAVIILSSIGFLIIGFELQDALLVGFLAGIFNIIPYLGPFIGTIFALFVGLVSYLNDPSDRNILAMALLIIIVCTIVQLIDNMLVQPYVYSNSVRAHPLEIFLVFLTAGTLGGFVGMILAIPAYIVIREFAKEFILNFRINSSTDQN